MVLVFPKHVHSLGRCHTRYRWYPPPPICKALMLLSPLHSDISLSFGPKYQATIHSRIRSVAVLPCPILNTPIICCSNQLLLKCVVIHTFIFSNRVRKAQELGIKLFVFLPYLDSLLDCYPAVSRPSKKAAVLRRNTIVIRNEHQKNFIDSVGLRSLLFFGSCVPNMKMFAKK